MTALEVCQLSFIKDTTGFKLTLVKVHKDVLIQLLQGYFFVCFLKECVGFEADAFFFLIN